MVKYIHANKYNYTLNQSGYPLKLPLNIDGIIPEDDSVRLLLAKLLDKLALQLCLYP